MLDISPPVAADAPLRRVAPQYFCSWARAFEPHRACHVLHGFSRPAAQRAPGHRTLFPRNGSTVHPVATWDRPPERAAPCPGSQPDHMERAPRPDGRHRSQRPRAGFWPREELGNDCTDRRQTTRRKSATSSPSLCEGSHFLGSDSNVPIGRSRPGKARQRILQPCHHIVGQDEGQRTAGAKGK